MVGFGNCRFGVCVVVGSVFGGDLVNLASELWCLGWVNSSSGYFVFKTLFFVWCGILQFGNLVVFVSFCVFG